MMQILIDVPDNKARTLLDVLRHISFITGIKSKKRPKNPNNPSPSGDPWFDDPENMQMLDEAMQEFKEGKFVTVENSKELQNFFAMVNKQ
jgi:hypothetical protein